MARSKRCSWLVALAFCTIAGNATAAEVDGASAAALVAGTAGKWKGELQYRDYQSNSWQGLPMEVLIAVQPDQVTTVRTARYDDGPQTGIVTITTTAMIDPSTAMSSYAVFRKGRAVDSGQARITAIDSGGEPVRWSIVTLETRKDGDGMAQVRETTTRDGDTLTTLKEVDPLDDTKVEWLPRNRSVLKRVGD